LYSAGIVPKPENSGLFTHFQHQQEICPLQSHLNLTLCLKISSPLVRGSRCVFETPILFFV
jgi:hypothetical protein